MSVNCFCLQHIFVIIFFFSAAWKSPINLTIESHERVKRSLSEPAAVPKPKKIRTLPPLEAIPDEIVCTNPPDADKIPRILLSQIDNSDGLKRAIR